MPTFTPQTCSESCTTCTPDRVVIHDTRVATLRRLLEEAKPYATALKRDGIIPAGQDLWLDLEDMLAVLDEVEED